MTSQEFQSRLSRRARRAGLAPSGHQVTAGLEAYLRLLSRWNKKINLTALSLDEAPDDAIDRLLIEPLAAVRHLPRLDCSVIDIGSGGGSPAVPMKLADPSLKLIMVESKIRKAAFLREVVRTLELDGVTVETSRYEELLARPELHEALDVVTVRAVRLEPRTLRGVQAFLKRGGRLLLFRGPVGYEGLPTVTVPLVIEGVYPLVEALRSQLVVMRKT